VIVQPVVTVIIPTYNTEAYVAKAIQSALDQTLQNIEIIVMDDSSADGSVAVAQTFQDERLKVVVNERNLGATTSSNRALEMAQGEWIAILDSDDWMAPERLERMVQVGRAENADLIVDDPYLIRDGEAALIPSFSLKRMSMGSALCAWESPSPCLGASFSISMKFAMIQP
jgi:succinoglycan biosynthesis protein ExoO